MRYVKNEIGFIDANSLWVKSWDVVAFGVRKGILTEIFEDGYSTVWFADVQKSQLVRCDELCKVAT